MVKFKRILVPLDGSSLSETALPVAMALAEKFDSQIILFRALDYPFFTVSTVPRLDPNTSARILEAYEHMHQDAESYLAAQEGQVCQHGIDARTVLNDASPAESIIDAAVAEDVDLIVMSTHGRGGLARWTFGSVADKVARHSPCPVLLVRQPPRDVPE